jgi:hypothetical protein
MSFFVIATSIIFTIFSTAILSYISIATMVGPWIAPIIVLMTSALLKFQKNQQPIEYQHTQMALIQTVGSVGGIVGTGVGFSLPTLYFLNPQLFNQWLNAPLYFCSILAAACFVAGGLGIWLARSIAGKFIEKENLSFPVSQLIHKTITSQTQGKQAKNMFFGVVASWIICFLRDGIFRFKGILAKVYYIFPGLLGKEVAIAISPMFWAIGFITGIKIVFPLLVGMISKYIIAYPINNHSIWLPFKLFEPLKLEDFISAFCSGLVVAELVLGLLKYPGAFLKYVKTFSGFEFFAKAKSLKDIIKNKFNNNSTNHFKNGFLTNLEPALTTLASIIFLSYLNFSLPAIIFLLVFTLIFTYQLSYLSGRIGLVTFGRFATFIMIPMIF